MTAPLPAVMVSCGDMENSNILTIAWTGIINSHPPITYVSVRKERFSHRIISETGEFVINLTTDDLAGAMDFCGVKSGRDTDKFRHLGLTREQGDVVAAPLIAESPVNLECRVIEVKEFPTHDMFIAEIVSVHIDERFVDENGAFLPHPSLFRQTKPSVELIMWEVTAQLERLRTLGFAIRYIDSHMFSELYVDGLDEALEDFAKRNGLLDHMYYYHFLPYGRDLSQFGHQAEFPDGQYFMLIHPAEDSEEMRLTGRLGTSKVLRMWRKSSNSRRRKRPATRGRTMPMELMSG